MFFSKTLTYENKKDLFPDKLFSKINDRFSCNNAYRVKIENNQIIMKPINNWIVYNSFKPIIIIFCTTDLITLNISLKKTSIFTLFFSIVFVIILDLMTLTIKLYSDPEWLLALLIAHIVIVVLTVCAKLSLIYFYNEIDYWFQN